MELLGLSFAFCLPLAAANSYTYSGHIDFQEKGWDAAFGDPGVIHDNWNQAGNTGYRANIAAADIPRPGYGGNDPEDNLWTSTVWRHRVGQDAHDMSPRDEQKPIGPEKPKQDGTASAEDDVKSARDGLKLKGLCATIYHLGEEAQKRARYDDGNCKSFLSDDCMYSMMSETGRYCEDFLRTKEPLVRSPSSCVGSDSAVSFGGIEHSLEWDAFWAYHGDAHDPADKGALVAMQEAVVPIVWHTTQSFQSDKNEFTDTRLSKSFTPSSAPVAVARDQELVG
ncbi:hypothetical protein PG994_007118 [Apiospora phragmitis]|uniref:Uncharacterized protein n=1 Tax=Apiospora phragmitis TaxID=2905665 RepID=A0ABR1UZX7_9PEZI